MNFNLKNAFHISILLISLLYTACKEDDFLEGYNRNELFAEPTPSELETVMSDWNSRDLSAKNYKVEQEIKLTTANAVLKVVSFMVNGYTEYSALVIPEGNTKLPVRMYVGGFAIHNNVNAIKLVMDITNDNPFIFAFPALRGQSLRLTIDNIEYASPVSGGDHCDAFDGATDDVISFLNVIEKYEAAADASRTSVRGGSRGATVSLLAAARDKRIKRAVGVAGPVNLLTLTASSENDKTYQCQFLNNLVNERSSIQAARLKMIASSPVYFAASFPKIQLHLGKDDRIVPVSQGEHLKALMTGIGNADSLDLFIYDGKTHENIAINNNHLNDRINEFLKEI